MVLHAEHIGNGTIMMMDDGSDRNPGSRKGHRNGGGIPVPT
jgi:hypothetical protein